MSETSNKLHTPGLYHRDYKNDTPSHDALNQGLRIAQAALPFIALYKPLGQPLSIILGSTRIVSSVQQLINAFADGDINAIGRTTLETAIASTALVCSITAQPLGMVLTTSHDMLKNIVQINDFLQKEEYSKAAGAGLQLTNNGLYLGSFFTGSLQWSIASTGMQLALESYNAWDKFKNGKDKIDYLEGAGHLLIACIRGKQMVAQVRELQNSKIVAQEKKAIPEKEAIVTEELHPAFIALHATIDRLEKEIKNKELQNLNKDKRLIVYAKARLMHLKAVKNCSDYWTANPSKRDIFIFKPDHVPGCCYYDGPNYLETVVEMYANEESLQMLKSFLNNARSAGYYDQVLQVTQPFLDVLNQIKQGINAPIPKSIAVEGKIPGSSYEVPMSIDEAKLLLKSPQSWLSKFVRRQEDIRRQKLHNSPCQ